MSQNVLADAQFTLAGILRPFEGFEQTYQGQSIFVPIAFPGTLDPDAGKPGFSPYLLGGFPVPMGAKMQLWLPAVVGLVEGAPLIDYRYQLVWRLRNVGDFQRRRLPYHLLKEAVAAPDTYLAPTPPERFLLPAATETVVYQQPEPAPAGGLLTVPGGAWGNLRSEAIDVPSDLADDTLVFPTAGLPFLPPNAAPPFANDFPNPTARPNKRSPLGAFQQGVIDPAVSNLAPYPLFRPYFTVAKGDEMLIVCYRNNSTVGPDSFLTWDFAGVDQQFSNLYGTNAFPPSGQTSHKPFPDLGIYVFAGSNPS